MQLDQKRGAAHQDQCSYSATVAAQVSKLKERFGIQSIAWAGDRGMLTTARIEQVLKPQGMDWVSSLRAPQIAQLAGEHGPFQPSLFDERNLLELTSEHFAGERLVVCRNPALAEERASRCAVSRPSRCAWGASSSASTWPSISTSRSPRRR